MLGTVVGRDLVNMEVAHLYVFVMAPSYLSPGSSR